MVARGPGLVVRHRLPPSTGGVALTFDDCDRADAWDEILDVLCAEEVTAAFFANGMRVVQFPDQARRTVREGHVVGAHGWDHADLSRLSGEEVECRLRADRQAWCGVGADEVALFRPPYGRFDAGTLQAAQRAGYRQVVLWDVDPLDWQLAEPDEIVARVLDGCSQGSIVDLHVTAPTAAALPILIRGLRQVGLACVPLPGRG
jgi:peptidoglycan/xylan/chitin deacetylase (PgdA/CDA1 family)